MVVHSWISTNKCFPVEKVFPSWCDVKKPEREL